MLRSPIFLMLACAVFALAGCEKPIRPKPQVAAQPDKVSLMLAEAAEKTSSAMETLAAVEQARSPEVAIQPINNAPPELMRAMTVDWAGSVEPITKTLAERAGYNFAVVGTTPPVPVVVTLDVENQPVIEILRSVGLQLGLRGNIRVDARNRVVEIHYAPVTGVGG